MILIYAKYLTRQLFWTTVFLTFALTGAVWLTQSLRYIDFIMTRSLSIFTFIKLVSFLLPNLIATILPISLLIGTLLVIHKLYTDNELIVLRAVGLSNFQLILPALTLAGLVSLLLYGLNLYVHPVATQQYKGLKNEIRNNLTNSMIQSGEFNSFRHMTVFVKNRTQGGDLNGIFIYDLTDPRKPISITAKKGVILDKDNGLRIILFQGTRQSLDSKSNKPAILTFDEYTMEINNPPDVYERDRKPGEFFLNELLNPQADTSTQLRHKLIVEAHHRLLFPLIVFPFVLIGCLAYLFGDYDRRGRAKRAATAIGACISLEVVLLILLNLSDKSSWLLYSAYGVVFLTILTVLILLLKIQKFKKVGT